MIYKLVILASIYGCGVENSSNRGNSNYGKECKSYEWDELNHCLGEGNTTLEGRIQKDSGFYATKNNPKNKKEIKKVIQQAVIKGMPTKVSKRIAAIAVGFGTGDLEAGKAALDEFSNLFSGKAACMIKGIVDVVWHSVFFNPAKNSSVEKLTRSIANLSQCILSRN